MQIPERREPKPQMETSPSEETTRSKSKSVESSKGGMMKSPEGMVEYRREEKRREAEKRSG